MSNSLTAEVTELSINLFDDRLRYRKSKITGYHPHIYVPPAEAAVHIQEAYRLIDASVCASQAAFKFRTRTVMAANRGVRKKTSKLTLTLICCYHCIYPYSRIGYRKLNTYINIYINKY